MSCSLYEGKHVLLLEGYCKQSLPFIRSFKSHGCIVSVLCNSHLDCAYVSRLPDYKIIGMCDITKPLESEEFIINLIKTGRYDLVVPLFDFSARILSSNKDRLSKYAYIFANDEAVYSVASDKLEVMKACERFHIPSPKTRFDIKSDEDLNDLVFPVIIKPRNSYGARGYHSFDCLESLIDYIYEKRIKLEDHVIQEMIPLGSKVIGANIFVDKTGCIKSSYLYICEHIFPENGGTSTLNAILNRKDILEYCESLALQLNLKGLIGIDLMIDSRDGIGKVIEINARPVHGIALGFYCGVDHALQILEDVFCQSVSYMSIDCYDTCMRITQTDVLWFIKSDNRFKLSPHRLGYKHVKDQMFSLDDPLPWAAFLLDGLINYKRKIAEKTQ